VNAIVRNSSPLATTPERPSFATKMVSTYRDNAEQVLAKSIDIRSPQCTDQILEIARILTPFVMHKNSSSSSSTSIVHEGEEKECESIMDSYNIIIEPLGGGLSNELFTVRYPVPSKQKDRTILVRIHPEEERKVDDDSEDTTDHDNDNDNDNDNDDDDNDEERRSRASKSQSQQQSDSSHPYLTLVDREIENQLVAWLSTQGIAPIYYGRFRNGRVEEFFENVVPLSCHEMKYYAPHIACRLAEFHHLIPPHHILPKPNQMSEAYHFVNVNKWFLMATHYCNNNNNNNKKNKPEDAQFLESVQQEWEWLQSYLLSEDSDDNPMSPIQKQAYSFIRQLVMAHMDGQSLNILRDTTMTNPTTTTASKKNPIRLIDFEYAGWNPRAADIANTFCEYCDMNNLCAKYDQEYPSINDQNVFLRAYLEKADPSMVQQLNQQEPSQWDIVLEVLRTEINKFTLLSCLGWTVWSVVKANEELNGIDFDYMQYGRHRMEGYNYFKSQFIGR
jgi:thiamine kinase-like enzyme